MDLDLSVADLLVEPDPDAARRARAGRWPTARSVRLSAADRRRPRGGRAGAADVEDGVRALLERCVEGAHGPAVRRRAGRELAARMAASTRRPRSGSAVCPACGEPTRPRSLDAAALLLDELAADATALYGEVHAIARRYHWSEAEILGLERAPPAPLPRAARRERQRRRVGVSGSCTGSSRARAGRRSPPRAALALDARLAFRSAGLAGGAARRRATPRRRAARPGARPTTSDGAAARRARAGRRSRLARAPGRASGRRRAPRPRAGVPARAAPPGRAAAAGADDCARAARSVPAQRSDGVGRAPRAGPPRDVATRTNAAPSLPLSRTSTVRMRPAPRRRRATHAPRIEVRIGRVEVRRAGRRPRRPRGRPRRRRPSRPAPRGSASSPRRAATSTGSRAERR